MVTSKAGFENRFQFLGGPFAAFDCARQIAQR
jgi:hypothetical protein